MRDGGLNGGGEVVIPFVAGCFANMAAAFVLSPPQAHALRGRVKTFRI